LNVGRCAIPTTVAERGLSARARPATDADGSATAIPAVNQLAGRVCDEALASTGSTRRAATLWTVGLGGLLILLRTTRTASSSDPLRQLAQAAAWARDQDGYRQVADRTTTTARLVIRPPTPADTDGWMATVDHQVIEENGWRPDDVEQLRLGAVTGTLVGKLLVCDQTTGEILGSIAVDPFAALRGFAELGFWIGPKARGQGIATEAVGAIVAAWHRAGEPNVVVGTGMHNRAVRRVMDKLGGEEIRHGTHWLPNRNEIEAVWYVLRAPATRDDGAEEAPPP
jgi:RimJ/RimL family protein N-acetyltransferase